jgi:Holliday junction resolvase RusA-like endonuclease
MDGLNGVVWKDDAQVCDLHVKKRYSDNEIEEMRVIITELTA